MYILCVTEGERVDPKKDENISPENQLNIDKEQSNLNLNFEVGSSSQCQNTPRLTTFDLEELQTVTHGFTSQCLGEGGFGKVFKGYLEKHDQVCKIK